MTSHTATQILDCAQALLVERGYNGFSYADVAQQVAISKPSIHHHFPTKADLAVKVVQRYREHIGMMMEEGMRRVTDPALQLAAYVDYWAACIGSDSMSFCVCAMLASERRTLPPALAAEVAGHFRFLASWLAGVLTRGAQGGQFALRADAAAEAQCFMASIHGAMLSARAMNDTAVFASVAQSAIARMTVMAPSR